MAASFNATVGSSTAPNAYEAGRQAGLQALAGNREGKLALAFASSAYDLSEVFRGVSEALGPIPVCGSTSVGEMSCSGFHEQSVTVAVMEGQFRFASAAEAYGVSPKRAAFRVANACLRELKGRSFDVALVYCSAELGHSNLVVETIKEVLGETTLLFGGGSGPVELQPEVYGPSYQYWGGQLVKEGVVLLLLSLESPNLRVATAVSHGLQPISAPMPVTRAEGHWVHEVNGEPVFDFYEKYTGRRVEDVGPVLRTYPFLVQQPGFNQTLAVAPYFIDRERGRIGFYPTGSMEGRTVMLAHFARNEIIRACRESAYNARVALGEFHPRLMLATSCAARLTFLGNRVNEEAQILSEVFGEGVPLIGCYGAAEFVPLRDPAEQRDALLPAARGSCVVGETFSLLVVGDSSTPVQACDGCTEAAAPDAPELPLDERFEAARQQITRLERQIGESERQLELRERVLLKVNKENIDVTSELRAANLRLSELNQRNLRLQRVIKQYTPRSTWNKAGKAAGSDEIVEIPDELVNLTYLFLDVKGFTTYSESHTPQEVVASLNDIFGPCTDIIYENSGDVHKYIGDAIFATFEVPQDAVEAALCICREIGRLDTPFKVRIGIHQGRSIHGNVGSDLRRDNTLIGDAVNMSQRLESNCEPGGVLLSRRVYDAVKDLMTLDGSFRTIQVKGKTEPLEVFDLKPGSN